MDGQHFTQDFLARGIASNPVWTAFPEAQLDAFVEALRSVYAPNSASSELNEAITESEIIAEVLAQLGWADLWLPQVTASGARPFSHEGSCARLSQRGRGGRSEDDRQRLTYSPR